MTNPEMTELLPITEAEIVRRMCQAARLSPDKKSNRDNMRAAYRYIRDSRTLTAAQPSAEVVERYKAQPDGDGYMVVYDTVESEVVETWTTEAAAKEHAEQLNLKAHDRDTFLRKLLSDGNMAQDFSHLLRHYCESTWYQSQLALAALPAPAAQSSGWMPERRGAFSPNNRRVAKEIPKQWYEPYNRRKGYPLGDRRVTPAPTAQSHGSIYRCPIHNCVHMSDSECDGSRVAPSAKGGE